MDPYLEPAWSDVHAKLVAFIAEPLSEQLPAGLRVISEEDLSIASVDPDDPRSVRPDVVISDSGQRGGRAGTAVMGREASRSLKVHMVGEPRAQKRVLIVESQAGGRVVTAIEVLSPINKAAGAGNRKYLRKLQAYRDGAVNIVEIDLLRHPSREYLEVNPSHLPAEYQSPYVAGICRAAEPSDWEIIPISLRARIPLVPVPLRSDEAEATLDLQPVIDRIYRMGRYDEVIDYTRPLSPPLSDDDAAWAREQIARGRQ